MGNRALPGGPPLQGAHPPSPKHCEGPQQLSLPGGPEWSQSAPGPDPHTNGPASDRDKAHCVKELIDIRDGVKTLPGFGSEDVCVIINEIGRRYTLRVLNNISYLVRLRLYMLYTMCEHTLYNIATL